MAERQKAFVAYPSKDQALADLLMTAIRRANAKPIPLVFEPWPFNDIAGRPLTSPILEKIDESPFVVADVTYLNLNVVYEVGYAIGRSRRAYLIRNKAIDGDKALANAAGIFDTLGYVEYTDAANLSDILAAHIDEAPINFNPILDRQALIYLVEPPTRTQAAAILLSRMKKAGFRSYQSFNPDEDVRLSAIDAIRKVSSASGVALLLQDEKIPGYDVHNIRTMFVAGLASGMGKPLLLLAPHKFRPPTDVLDIVKFFQRDSDIADAVGESAPAIIEYSAQGEDPSDAPTNLLQSLKIGDPRAENEMTTLGQYYLQTPEYGRALNGDVNLVLGRKGSGKTALWIQVRNKTRSDKRNIVVDLKPDGYQLIKLKEDILQFLTEGSREHLITAFWEYLILLEVAYKLLENDAHTFRQNHKLYDDYIALKSAYFVGEFSGEGDFAERLLTLSQKLTNEYQARYSGQEQRRLLLPQVTEILYSHDLKQLRKAVSGYLEHKESVWVLFDNLDRGWSTKGADYIDSIVLRCLVDAGRKLEREMRRDDHSFHCIVFIRNDVYDHVMRATADHGKESRAELDWSEPDQLREMLRLRLVNGLEPGKRDISFYELWHRLCITHYCGEESSAYLIDRSLMRPRNFLKLFNACRGAATLFHRQQITADDIAVGLKAYSKDLTEDLNKELADIFPEAADLLVYFIDQSSVLTASQLQDVMREAGIDAEYFEKLEEFLLYYGIIGFRITSGDHYIFNVNYDLRVLKIRASREVEPKYIINPAFWPALNISPPEAVILDQHEIH